MKFINILFVRLFYFIFILMCVCVSMLVITIGYYWFNQKGIKIPKIISLQRRMRAKSFPSLKRSNSIEPLFVKQTKSWWSFIAPYKMSLKRPLRTKTSTEIFLVLDNPLETFPHHSVAGIHGLEYLYYISTQKWP